MLRRRRTRVGSAPSFASDPGLAGSLSFVCPLPSQALPNSNRPSLPSNRPSSDSSDGFSCALALTSSTTLDQTLHRHRKELDRAGGYSWEQPSESSRVERRTSCSSRLDLERDECGRRGGDEEEVGVLLTLLFRRSGSIRFETMTILSESVLEALVVCVA